MFKWLKSLFGSDVPDTPEIAKAPVVEEKPAAKPAAKKAPAKKAPAKKPAAKKPAAKKTSATKTSSASSAPKKRGRPKKTAE